MTSLALAALYWIVLHFVIAGPARSEIAGKLGERGFQGIFAALSAIGLVWLGFAYGRAPEILTWGRPPGARSVALVLVFLASLLLLYGASASNATSPAIAGLSKERLPVAGITRITRHPMLWSFALWAGAHLYVNGDLASLLLFGAILVTALNGMVSIDRKRRRALGAVWDEFAAKTSRIPFVAIAARRNELRLGELAAWRALAGAALFLVLLFAHPYVIGVSPLAY